jgi:hypothetical protein
LHLSLERYWWAWNARYSAVIASDPLVKVFCMAAHANDREPQKIADLVPSLRRCGFET